MCFYGDLDEAISVRSHIDVDPRIMEKHVLSFAINHFIILRKLYGVGLKY